MTEFLIKKFVKNYTQTEDAKVREHYGRLSSHLNYFRCFQ